MPSLRSRFVGAFRSATLIALICGVAGPPIGRAAIPRPGEIHTLDLRPLQELPVTSTENAHRVWDTVHLAAALQGLANRDAARFYLYYCREFGIDTDQFWLDWFRGTNGWLREVSLSPLPDLDAALRCFRESFDGLVVYDPTVPATSNLASTAAGRERLLPVRFDRSTRSLFHHLTRELGLPVRLWLVREDGGSVFTGKGTLPHSDQPSSGSAKVDAYRWALERWMAAGTHAPAVPGAYYLDAFWLQRPDRAQADLHTLSNHDWFIAHQAFFFDLAPWGDESPVDDPGQPIGADHRCLLEVLRRLYDRSGGGIVKIGGFPPWPYKYTSHGGAGRHEPVATEWEFTRLISQFNAYKEADAAGPGAMANASFFQWFPRRDRNPQPNPRPGIKEWRGRGFVSSDGQVAPRLFVAHYVGDYDAPSWLYKAVPVFFNDPARGRVPLGWAIDPNLADRAPQALAYAYLHASTNDFFIAGDSGAGYLNPRGLTVRPDSGLPSGLAAWTRHCAEAFRAWDMSITGFMLDGAAGASTDLEFGAYRSFSPDGCGTHFERGPAMRAGVATCPERDLPDREEDAARQIADQARAVKTGPGFLLARSILKSPGWYADVSRRLREQYPDAPVDIVDPYTFFGLIRLHLDKP